MSRGRKRPPLRAEWSYALLGIFLGIGAPAGQLLVRMATNAEVRAAPLADVQTYFNFYGYQLLGTCIIFCAAGLAAGHRAELLRRNEEHYHNLSEHDPLTGLLNARAFQDRCARATERAARVKVPVSMLLIDVDGLKEINDRHGHAVGNDALRRVASAINLAKRSEDDAARWGGDEFTVLLQGGDADAAARVGESIMARLRMLPIDAGAGERVVTVTIGIATALQPVKPEELFAAADQALYEGKSQGRNRIAAGQTH